MPSESPAVALFMPDLGGGGAERMMVNLALGLQARGVVVELVLATARGPYLSEVSGRLPVVDLGAGSVLRSAPALARYLRRARPTALVATLQHANLVALLARRLAGVATRVYLREANAISVAEGRSLKSRVVLRLAARYYPAADGVIAVSEGVAHEVRDLLRVPPEKVATIYNPVITEDVFEKRLEPPAHPWLGDGGPPVVLGVGRLTRQKDFATLLRAFALVRRARPARLLILGEGEERDALTRLAAELGLTGEVALPGFVSNPFACMARASVFALSSAWEGLPGVLIQALACGCPVVSTDCPSGPAEVLEGGRYGPLVPVGDPAALAQAILATLEAPGDPAARVARAREFSLERSVDAYLAYLGVQGAASAPDEVQAGEFRTGSR